MSEDTSSTSVWQVAAGPWERDYSDLFLECGVALIGPGDPGRWRPERDDGEFEGSFVRRFASEEVSEGDIILLRAGSSTLRAVGIVASGYMYLEQFDDVNGWDLQHARRVRWCKLPEPETFETRVFGAVPQRFSAVSYETLLDYAIRFINSSPTDWQSAPLPPLPPDDPLLKEAPDFVRGLVSQVLDLSNLYLDSERFGEWPKEQESVSHFVVPFLRCLGWPVECIGVEWRNVDVAVFRQLPRIPENVQFLVEAKRLGSGVEGALDQVRGYLARLGVECDVVVTDGVRYRMYKPSGSDFESEAYANLGKLKQSALALFTRMRRQ